MDALSQALTSVRMTGAIFADLICTAPWGLAIPGVEPLAEALAPGTECVVGYHLVIEGNALVGLEGAEDLPVMAGDLVIIPHGDPHTITNGAPPRSVSGTIDKWLAGDGAWASRSIIDGPGQARAIGGRPAHDHL